MMMLSSSSAFVNGLPRSAVSRPEGAGEALRCRGRRKSTAYSAPGAVIWKGGATSAPPEIGLMSALTVIGGSSSRCCRALRQRAEVHLVGRGVAEGLVQASRVVEREVLRQRALRLVPVRVPPQVDLFVFHAPPQP